MFYQKKQNITLSLKKENEVYIQEVADILSYNYVSSSFKRRELVTKKTAKFQSEYAKKFFTQPDEFIGRLGKIKEWRTIAIFGAGATYSAYKSIPLADDFIEILKQHPKFSFGTLTKYDNIKDKYDYLRSKLNDHKTPNADDRIDFETELSILSNFYHPDSIKNLLKETYNFRYPVSPIYEIIAHQFRHRMIDVILNFNFDEILEQAIEEEIGDENYHLIISDGHCKPLNEFLVEQRLKNPIYIKPHGTASHNSTLRFTKDSYFNIPQEMDNLIKGILNGQFSDEAQNKDLERINILVFGFGMKSIELNATFKEILKNERKELHIYHFDLNKNKKTIESKTNYTGIPEVDENVRLKVKCIGLDDNYSLLDALQDIWNCIDKNFVEKYSPRGLARHEIITYLFYKNNTSIKPALEESDFNQAELLRKYFKTDQYFYDRTIIEMAIALVKSKGHLEISSIMNERVGTFYDLYRQKRENKNFVELSEICEKVFNMSQDKSFGRNLYSIPKKDRTEDKHKPNISKLSRHIWDLLSNFAHFTRRSELKLSDHLVKAIDQIPEKNNPILEHLNDLYRSFTSDIKFNFTDKSFYIFDNCRKENILHTNMALTYNFYDQLAKDNEWTHLISISERGKLIERIKHYDRELYNKLVEKKKKIMLIVADVIDDDSKTPKELDDLLINNKYYELPYWYHNDHMAIFLKEKSKGSSKYTGNQPETYCGNYTFVKSIFYERKGYDNKINPIIFDNSFSNRNNHLMLMETFWVYFKSAQNYSSQTNAYPKSILHLRNKKGIESELLQDLKDVFDGKI